MAFKGSQIDLFLLYRSHKHEQFHVKIHHIRPFGLKTWNLEGPTSSNCLMQTAYVILRRVKAWSRDQTQLSLAAAGLGAWTQSDLQSVGIH